MKLFVGLGNPGKKYEGNRHNAGFMAVDAMAEAFGAPKWSKKFSGEIAEISVEDEKIILLKPQTYMNLSGQSVGAATQFYKINPLQVTVFHDELDIPLGEIRIKTGGGHGGHNGLKDIDAHIGKEYRRVRLGIGHPGHKDMVSDYVLHDFSKAERETMDELIGQIIRQLELLVRGEDADFAREVKK